MAESSQYSVPQDFAATVARLRNHPSLLKLEDRQSVKPQFSKWSAYYASQAKLKKVACGNCVWFVPPGDGGAKGACRLVSSVGAPGDGEISAGGVCALWNAMPSRILGVRLLRGRGQESNGFAPGNFRYHMERLYVKGERTVPPAAVRARIIFPSGFLGLGNKTPLQGASVDALVTSAPSTKVTPERVLSDGGSPYGDVPAEEVTISNPRPRIAEKVIERAAQAKQGVTMVGRYRLE